MARCSLSDAQGLHADVMECSSSSDEVTNRDENSQRILLRYDGKDPYIDNLGDFDFQVEVDEDVQFEVDEDIQVVPEEQVLLEDAEPKEKIKPYVGLEFRTHDEAYKFYNNYTCHAGFSVRKASQAKSRKGLTSIRFVCNKEGFSNK